MSLDSFIGRRCTIVDPISEDLEEITKDSSFDPKETYPIAGCFVAREISSHTMYFVFVHPETMMVHIIKSQYCKVHP